MVHLFLAVRLHWGAGLVVFWNDSVGSPPLKHPVSETGPTSILQPVPQHWSAARICVEPASLFHLRIRLHPTHPTNSDYICTAVVGQISDNKENAYPDEVSSLTGCCKHNNLTLSVRKTKDITVDFRRYKHTTRPLIINGEEVEKVSCFEFRGVFITEA